MLLKESSPWAPQPSPKINEKHFILKGSNSHAELDERKRNEQAANG